MSEEPGPQGPADDAAEDTVAARRTPLESARPRPGRWVEEDDEHTMRATRRAHTSEAAMEGESEPRGDDADDDDDRTLLAARRDPASAGEAAPATRTRRRPAPAGTTGITPNAPGTAAPADDVLSTGIVSAAPPVVDSLHPERASAPVAHVGRGGNTPQPAADSSPRALPRPRRRRGRGALAAVLVTGALVFLGSLAGLVVLVFAPV